MSLATPDAAYTQDFDTLADSSTSSTVPTGWSFVETGTAANTTYAADAGSSMSGNTYSYGAAASTEHAFGTLQSGSLTSTIGACFSNDTGGDLTSLDIAYAGEEWRLGTASRTDELDFQYSTDATDLSSGTWTAVAALNFTTPNTATTGAKDGNSAADRTALSTTIGSLAIPAGATFRIRWIDVNASGSDDGLAVDDFSLTPHGNGAGGPTNPGGVGAASPANVVAGGDTLLTVTVTPGTMPDSTGLTVSADLGAIGGSATLQFYDDGSNGDVAAGDNVFSYAATVAIATASGAKSLPATIGDEQTRSAGATIPLTVSTAATIMEIQGHGMASPLAGDIVTTSGNIVTALKSNGFFMQDPVGDGDLTTSDGIFVYTSSVPSVTVGDAVTVTGKVQEYSGSTELSGSVSVAATSSGNLLPDAYVLDGNPPTDDPTTGICIGANSTIDIGNADTDGYQATNFACLDGMRVAMADATVTGATSASGANGISSGTPSFLYAKVTGGGLPYRGVGALYPGLGAGIPVWNGEPEVVEVYFSGLTGFDKSSAVYNAGSRVSLTGIVQGFTPSGATAPTYEIYPSDITPIQPVSTAAAIQPVADSGDGTLTIATQNLLHFFNATADGYDTSSYHDTCTGSGSGDTCPTPAQYAIRLDKAARQICNVLKAPAVAELEEVENISVLGDIASAVFDTCYTPYVPYLIPGNDPGGINIGLLVRSDVTVNRVTQIYKGTNTVNCGSGSSCLLNDRPPLLLDATYGGYRFAVLAIYDRSLSGLGDSSKPYVGPKRAEQAAQIAQIVQAWQSGATLAGAGDAQYDSHYHLTSGSFDVVGQPDVPLAISGDFNAYEFTDGYADVTGMIAGSAVQAQNVYWFDGNVADTDTPAYVAPDPNLVDSGIASTSRYSYNFDGMKQEIDHILLTRTAWKDFVAISNAHGNSDVSEADPAVEDATTPARTSDHDGQVVTLALDRIFVDGNEPQP